MSRESRAAARERERAKRRRRRVANAWAGMTVVHLNPERVVGFVGFECGCSIRRDGLQALCASCGNCDECCPCVDALAHDVAAGP